MPCCEVYLKENNSRLIISYLVSEFIHGVVVSKSYLFCNFDQEVLVNSYSPRSMWFMTLS